MREGEGVMEGVTRRCVRGVWEEWLLRIRKEKGVGKSGEEWGRQHNACGKDVSQTCSAA